MSKRRSRSKMRWLPALIATALCLALGSAATGEPAAPLTAAWQDNFDGPTMDPRWECINEEPDYWSLSERSGFLRIMQLSGEPTKNLLKQAAPPGDYDVTVRVQFAPSRDFQKAGVIISQGDGNAVYLFRGACFNPAMAFCNDDAIYFEKWEQGNFLMQSLDPWTHTDTYLRLSKRGASYTGYASTDGVSWTEVGTWYAPGITDPRPGLVAHNPVDDPDPAGIIPADFDFFRLDYQTNIYLPLVNEE